MKTPIVYYGGKLKMLKYILPLIPEHRIYVEPFFGGGAVFWAKEPAESEIINDINSMAINFYEVVRDDFEALKAKIESTLYARANYTVADTIYRFPHLFDKIQQAWAFYIGTQMGFAAKIGSWGYDKYGKQIRSWENKKEYFNENYSRRLHKTQIECNDAIKVIKSRDTEDTFIYLDPPYINTYQGHYSGYTEEQYRELLETLSTIKGKFLLSSFPSEILDEFIEKNNWSTIQISQTRSTGSPEPGGKRSVKTEVLTANYPLK